MLINFLYDEMYKNAMLININKYLRHNTYLLPSLSTYLNTNKKFHELDKSH